MRDFRDACLIGLHHGDQLLDRLRSDVALVLPDARPVRAVIINGKMCYSDIFRHLQAED